MARHFACCHVGRQGYDRHVSMCNSRTFNKSLFQVIHREGVLQCLEMLLQPSEVTVISLLALLQSCVLQLEEPV